MSNSQKKSSATRLAIESYDFELGALIDPEVNDAVDDNLVLSGYEVTMFMALVKRSWIGLDKETKRMVRECCPGVCLRFGL